MPPMEIIETVEIQGEDIALAALIHTEQGSFYRRVLYAYSAKHPDGAFCGHPECWLNLTTNFTMSLN